MFDCDPFNQWIIIPADDWSALPPVDEEVSGLKDITSILDPPDQHINEQTVRSSRGLLLGQDLSPMLPDADLFETITEFYGTPHTPSSLPPELSPDASPASSQASSTPWLRTPQSDRSLTNILALTPPALWDIREIDEYETQCAGISFVDECGNSLEDVSSQLSELRQEDVACTPYVPSDLPFVENLDTFPNPIPSPSWSLPAPLSTPPPTMTFPPSPPFSPPPPLPSQTFLAPPAAFDHYQEALSPLSNISIISPSRSPSPSPAPLPHSTLSPIAPPMSPSQPEEVLDAELTRSSRASRKRLRLDSLDEDTPLPEITRRSRATDIDDDEWQPSLERVKRPKVSPSPSVNRAPSVVSLDSHGGERSSQTTEEMSRAPVPQPDNTPTRCDVCQTGFTRASDYVRHLQNSSVHLETSEVYECPYCDSILGRKDALRRHIRSIHAGRPIVIPEGIPRSQFPDLLMEKSASRPPRKSPSKRPPKKGNRK